MRSERVYLTYETPHFHVLGYDRYVLSQFPTLLLSLALFSFFKPSHAFWLAFFLARIPCQLEIVRDTLFATKLLVFLVLLAVLLFLR